MRASGLRECVRNENVTVWTSYFFCRYASSDADRMPPPPEPAFGSSGVRKSARCGIIHFLGEASGLLPTKLLRAREGSLTKIVKAV